MRLKASLRRHGPVYPVRGGCQDGPGPGSGNRLDIFCLAPTILHPQRSFGIRTPHQQSHALLELSRSLGRACQHQDRVLGAEHDISPSQWQVLIAVRDEAPLPMGDLARRLQVTRSTATRLVDLLTKRGLVRRAPAPDDRRRMELDLTAEGLTVADDVEAALLHQQREILLGIPAAERPHVLQALARLEAAQRQWGERELPLDGG